MSTNLTINDRQIPAQEHNEVEMVHSQHPFAPDVDARDPVRRLRGRLAAPVTIVTAGNASNRTGLTLSLVAVVEGQPPLFYAFAGPTSDLWIRAGETRRFVAHVLGSQHAPLSDVFAGIRPSPGGLFAEVPTSDSEWGPVIASVPDRAYCTVMSQEEIGFSGLLIGTIDQIELSDLANPLVYFRGVYRSLK